jgi:transcriptional regulator with XRE-family HTH domain
MTQENKQVPYSLVIGRLIGALRKEGHVAQKKFSAELGMGAGTLGWIEAGRSNAYSVQVFLIEADLIRRGVLDRPGRLHEMLHAVISELAHYGIDLFGGRIKASRGETVEIDRIVGSVVARSFKKMKEDPTCVLGDVSVLVRSSAWGGAITMRSVQRRGHTTSNKDR